MEFDYNRYGHPGDPLTNPTNPTYPNVTAGPSGFNTKPYEKKMQKFEVSFSVPRDYEVTMDEIRYQMTSQLIKEIMDSQIVQFQDVSMSAAPYGWDKTYQALIFAASTPHTVMSTKSVYTIDKKDFTTDEVDEAMRNTYPERFL